MQVFRSLPPARVTGIGAEASAAFGRRSRVLRERLRSSSIACASDRLGSPPTPY
jgi:hypothetical protein